MQPERPDSNIREVIDANTELGKAICAALVNEAHKTGISDEVSKSIDFEQLEFSLNRDPFSQQDSLHGSWYGPHDNLIGSILFHADGSFFAEHDVVQPHPHKSGWFIEAVSAWGKDDCIKTETRLLPMPE